LPEITTPLFGPLTATAPESNPLDYLVQVQDDAEGLPGDADPGTGAKNIFAVDSNAILQTHLEAPGFYAASTAPYGDDWDGYKLTEEHNWIKRRNDFDDVADGRRATMGTLFGALEDFAGGSFIWDRQTEFFIDFIYDGGGLSSADESVVADGAVNGLLFANGEILQFANVEYITTLPNGHKRFRFDTLLRGRRGTEHTMSTHVSGEKVVLLNAAVQRYEIGVARIGKTLELKFRYEESEQVEELSLVVQGNSLKPFSPIHVKATQALNGDVTFTATRRSRKTGLGTLPLPLGEAESKFELDIMNGGIVVRTLASSELTAVYTAAMQTSDWSGGVPASFSVRWYQIGEVIGRGYPGIYTVVPVEETEVS
jgi:hypothetical protein